VIITGKSQSLTSSIGASRLAAEYAPDLELRAAIAVVAVSGAADLAIKFSD